MSNKAFGFNNTKPVNFSKRLSIGSVEDVENPNTGVMETGSFVADEIRWAAPRTMTITQRYTLEQAGHGSRFQMVIRGRFTNTSATYAELDGKIYRIVDVSVDQRNYYDVQTIFTLEDEKDVIGNG